MNIKRYFTSFIMTAMCVLTGQAGAAPNPVNTAYTFEFDSLSGKDKIMLADLRGKVIIVVNTASKCGFTPQYAALEKLYNTYKDRGLVIIGVPSNDFGGQEPGSNVEIEHFCRINFGVTFPMAARTAVTGTKAHPFFIWARKTLGIGSAPKWNFYKYLINRQGQLVDYYSSVTAPDSPRFVKAVEKALAQ
jgi:glutathione peroxidase